MIHDSLNCIWFRPQQRLVIFKTSLAGDVDYPWKGLALEGPKFWTDFKWLKIFEDVTYLPRKTATLEKNQWFPILPLSHPPEKNDQDAIMSTETPTATPIPHKTPLKTVRKKALLPKKMTWNTWTSKTLTWTMNHESSWFGFQDSEIWWLICRDPITFFHGT